ncbi:hypothetical protein [Solilutibacter silvestris]|nr:hypothetical protein [Lysobacter silvestris]
MSRSRWFPLFVSLTALAVGNAPAWAQQRVGRGGWPPPLQQYGGRMGQPLPLPPQGSPPGHDEPHGAPSPETPRPHPSASDCGRAMALSPGDQVLAVQPMDSNGRVQCRVKIMGADGMVRVMMVSPGY